MAHDQGAVLFVHPESKIGSGTAAGGGGTYEGEGQPEFDDREEGMEAVLGDSRKGLAWWTVLALAWLVSCVVV